MKLCILHMEIQTAAPESPDPPQLVESRHPQFPVTKPGQTQFEVLREQVMTENESSMWS
jgi:hypothetical protein